MESSLSGSDNSLRLPTTLIHTGAHLAGLGELPRLGKADASEIRRHAGNPTSDHVCPASLCCASQRQSTTTCSALVVPL